VRERYLEHNAGCGRAVSGAVDWFFSSVGSGVVLEDDCHPDPTFFPYCAELLDRYRGNDRVMSISGTSFDHPLRRGRAQWSYSFVKQPAVWGWASWRRAWARYRFELEVESIRDLPDRAFPRQSAASIARWRRTFSRVARGRIDTWDFQWTFAHFRYGGLAIAPSRSLVSNVASESGTHGGGAAGPWQELPTSAADDPIRHPTAVEVDAPLDGFIDRVHCNHRPLVARKLWKYAQRAGIISTAQIRAGRFWGRP
jgi:hypothetical protein